MKSFVPSSDALGCRGLWPRAELDPSGVAVLGIAIVAGIAAPWNPEHRPWKADWHCALAAKLRLAIRLEELLWSILAAGSILARIGFTMALFIAELAFQSDRHRQAQYIRPIRSLPQPGILALAWLRALIRR